MNDYEMWNGCEDGLKNEGYSFPDSIKEKSIQKQEEAKYRKRRNNKKALKKNMLQINMIEQPIFEKVWMQLQKEYRKYLQDKKTTKR